MIRSDVACNKGISPCAGLVNCKPKLLTVKVKVKGKIVPVLN